MRGRESCVRERCALGTQVQVGVKTGGLQEGVVGPPCAEVLWQEGLLCVFKKLKQDRVFSVAETDKCVHVGEVGAEGP